MVRHQVCTELPLQTLFGTAASGPGRGGAEAAAAFDTLAGAAGLLNDSFRGLLPRATQRGLLDAARNLITTRRSICALGSTPLASPGKRATCCALWAPAKICGWPGRSSRTSCVSFNGCATSKPCCSCL